MTSLGFLEEFDASLMRAAVEELGHEYYRSSVTDDCIVVFLGDSAGVPLHAYLSVEGRESHVYAIRVESGRYFVPDDWPRVVGLLNRWHQDRRWPKVSLEERRGSRGEQARISCEGHVHFPTRIHQSFVTNFTHDILTTTKMFWWWLTDQLPPSPLHLIEPQHQLKLDFSDPAEWPF
jgi:hypothetical protein